MLFQHGTIEEIIKHLDAKKYPLPDDWLEPSERAEKRKQAKEEAKARKEARAKEETKAKEEAAKSEANTEDEEKSDSLEDDRKVDGVTEEPAAKATEEGKDASAKRDRETNEGPESEEEVDDTPPMYRQARGLFLKPEVQDVHLSHKTRLSRFCADLVTSNTALPILIASPLFVNMQVKLASEYNLKWTDPDEPGLVKFLVEEKG